MRRAVCLTAGLALAACSEPSEGLSLSGRIVFSVDTGTHPIMHMLPDGRDRQAIPVEAVRPVQFLDVSPDGRRVVFQGRGRGGNPDIFFVNADGSGLRNLTDHPGLDAYPAWSPDGLRIAFASSRAFDDTMDVFTMDANGASLVNVTRRPGFDGLPDWLPDGTAIVVTSDRDAAGNLDIYRIALPDGGATRLTTDPEDDLAAHVSGDGQRLVFSSGRNIGAELFVMNRDGSAQAPLSASGPLAGDFARWSPDAAKVIVAPVLEILRIDVATGAGISLGRGQYPTWVP